MSTHRQAPWESPTALLDKYGHMDEEAFSAALHASTTESLSRLREDVSAARQRTPESIPGWAVLGIIVERITAALNKLGNTPSQQGVGDIADILDAASRPTPQEEEIAAKTGIDGASISLDDLLSRMARQAHAAAAIYQARTSLGNGDVDQELRELTQEGDQP